MLGHLLSLALAPRRRRFEAMKQDLVGHQRRALQRLLTAGATTAFGVDHGLGRVRSYEEYRRQVPLCRYADLEPYLAMIRAGRRDVLAAGMPKYWARTGGTTGKDKLVPIYAPGVAQSSGTFETALALHLGERPQVKLLGGRLLFLGSCSPLVAENGQAPSGFMSSILASELSPLVKHIVLPGSRVDHLPDWNEKIAAIFEMSHARNIVAIAGMPPWLYAFFRYVTERTGRPIAEQWPNLSLVLHSGVSMESYRSGIEQLVSPGGRAPLPSFRNAFGATEGNFAIQERDGDRDMLLVGDEVFFEFVPLDDYLAGRGDTARVMLPDVGKDVDYVLVLTTPGGLFSYVIGDTVRFTSLDPYKIVISGRTAELMNAAGEKVTVEQALAAVRTASEKTGVGVTEFTLFVRDAEPDQLPGHEWFLELDRPLLSPAGFLAALDEALASLNPLYRIRRASRFGDTPLLSPPSLRVLRPSTYAGWQRARGREGGHFKIPRISTQRDLRTELMKGTSDEPYVLQRPDRRDCSAVGPNAQHPHRPSAGH